jgi:hypothetical protein
MAALEEARLSPATTDRYEWRSRLRHIVFGAKTMHLSKARKKRSDGRANRCDATMERTPPYSPYSRPIRPGCGCLSRTRSLESLSPRVGKRGRAVQAAARPATSLGHGSAEEHGQRGEVTDRHGGRTDEMVNRYRHLLEAQDSAAARALEDVRMRPSHAHRGRPETGNPT